MKTVSLKFTKNDGSNSIFIVDNTNYMIETGWLEGFDYPEATVYSESKALSNGSFITNKNIPARNLRMTFESKHKDINDTIRNVVREFFSNCDEFTLEVVYKGNTRKITGTLSEFLCPTANAYGRVKATVGLLCENPFFEAQDYTFITDATGRTSVTFNVETEAMTYPLIRLMITSSVSSRFVEIESTGADGKTERGYININRTFTTSTSYLSDFNFDTMKVYNRGTDMTRYIEPSTMRRRGIAAGARTVTVRTNTGISEMNLKYTKLYKGL